MTDQKVILVTGVGSYWGAQVATRLLQHELAQAVPGFHVIGLDPEPLVTDIKGLDFIQADVRNPLLLDLLKSENVNTVCHLQFSESVRPTETAFDINVMGTTKLLAACAEVGVRKVVLKSSMAVYGAGFANPAFLTEQHPLQGSQNYGYTRYLVEIESFCNGFRRQVPEMILTILRFSGIVGPESQTPLARFLKEPLAPSLLGFDPLMQVIHEKDVVEALVHAIIYDRPGVFNVAAEGILPLSRLIALSAKVPLPVLHWCAYLGIGLANSMGLALGHYWPIEPDYLRYPWVGDLAKMREELGFTPSYTAEEALREFAGVQRLRRYMPGASPLAYDEERLRDTLERRRREREMNKSEAVSRQEEVLHE